MKCEVCGCDPCDCHGVNDELWGMAEERTDKKQQDNVLDGQEVGGQSQCVDQVETGHQPQNTILLDGLCDPCRYAEDAHKWDNTRSSQVNGDSD